MKLFHRFTTLSLCTFFLLAAGAWASELHDPRVPTDPALAEANWEYSGPLGPHSWRLFPGDEMCGEGQQQSPVAIEPGWNQEFQNTQWIHTLPALLPRWSAVPLQMVNNGHTLQVLHDPGSTVSIDGTHYDLTQFHFHSPSEHLLNERQYPLEIHFVHQSTDPAHPGTTVLAVMVDKGSFHPELEKIWRHAPHKVDSKQVVNVPGQTIHPVAFLPRGYSYFRYEGSLTTPPCTEKVHWIIYATPIQASVGQLRFFQKFMKGTNNRPIQSLNGRAVEAAYFRP